MRVAAIDCGTNTVLLLVAETRESELKPKPKSATDAPARLQAVSEFLEIPRLGQDLDRSGQLQPEAMQRTLDALHRQHQRALQLGAEKILVVGTESLRAAKNGQEFLTRAKEVLAGVPIRVISGEEEARLSFLSVAGSLPNGVALDGIRSVLDIGGGSTELVVGSGKTPSEWASVPIGSVRLSERLLKHDPPTTAEQQTLCASIDAALDGLPTPRGELFALAGTATTVAAIYLALPQHDSARIDGLRLPMDALCAICDKLASQTLAERRALAGLDPRRADVIYAGAMILWRVALRARAKEVIISDRGVRWGALEELLGV